jgi:hypothetical protein
LNAQHLDLLHKTHAQRAALLVNMYQDQLRNEDSLTIFTKIDAIKKLAADNADEDLLMEAALLRAHYFYYRERPQVLSMLDSLKEQAIKKNNDMAAGPCRKYDSALQLQPA